METKYYIGHSTNESIRFCSSSGGIGSALIEYLLSLPDYGTTLTFVFNKNKCSYEPKLIYSYREYNNCGSIYQDIDILGFLKKNVSNIRDGIVVTCMPCQVRAIRCLLQKKISKVLSSHYVVLGKQQLKVPGVIINFWE